MRRNNFHLVREFLLLTILNVLFQGIQCHVKARIKTYGKEYTKASLDLSDLNQEKKFILQNCSSVLWSDENCILGPIYLLQKPIPATLKQQVCPHSTGKLYLSCGYYAVCQDNIATINKCPVISDGIICPKNHSPCKNISTGSSDVNFIKSIVANQEQRLTLPTPGNKTVEEDSETRPYHRAQLAKVKKENEKKSTDPEDKDETTTRDPSSQLESDGILSNASYTGRRLDYDGTNDENARRESEQTESQKSKFLGKAEVSSCANFPNGIIRHPKSCEHFIQCVHGVENIRPCAPGTVFNAALSVCDWKSNVPDCTAEKSTGGDGLINLDDNRVRRSVMDHYNVIQHTNPWVSDVLSKQQHGDSSPRVKRDAFSNPSIISPMERGRRKCSWSPDYIQPHSDYCNKFEICSNGRIVEQSCGPGSLFNPLALTCDHPSNVDCRSRKLDYSTYGCQKEHSYKTSDPESCSKFVECDRGNLHIKSCPHGTLYDAEKELCDFSYKVKCKEPISLEHDTDVNYIPPLPSRSRRSYNNFNLACEFNYIAPNPRYCDQFVECENRRLFFKSCGPGTVFNGAIGQCDWAYNTRQADPSHCNQYFQCERSEYRVKRCLGNTVYNQNVKKCIFTPHFPDDCDRTQKITTTPTTTTFKPFSPRPPAPESASDY